MIHRREAPLLVRVAADRATNRAESTGPDLDAGPAKISVLA